jgi:hypothetical protein
VERAIKVKNKFSVDKINYRKHERTEMSRTVRRIQSVEDKRFLDHLKVVSEVVATWEPWERNLLS